VLSTEQSDVMLVKIEKVALQKKKPVNEEELLSIYTNLPITIKVR
jgi:hypothetical protein